ncbi:SUPPRESSOR OF OVEREXPRESSION OF CO 1, AGAMOUS-like 20 [Hibiscus trionum]|nr:SUPPRESSOR OF OVEREXPRESSION OF CO 1, AGAMOUS-like 20 [Hibiscus trionum]
MNKTIDRYEKTVKDAYGISSKDVEQNMLNGKEDAGSMEEKIEFLEDSKRKLLGHGLETSSVDDLQQLENQLERSLCRIRARKNQVFLEQIGKLKEEERRLGEENANLIEKCGMRAREPWDELQTQNMEVETELCIGPPARRNI